MYPRSVCLGMTMCKTESRNVTEQIPIPQPPAVLVVEDDVMLRVQTAMTLEDEGFTVIEADSADAALEVLTSRTDIRVVFTDIQMPGSMDGLKLAAAVRDRWPPIGIILTSGRGNIRAQDVPERGLFFPKPFDPSKLIEAMRGLLQ